MELLSDLTYIFVNFLIRIYKSTELFVFKIFASTVEQKVVSCLAPLGVSFKGKGVSTTKNLSCLKDEQNKKNIIEVQVHDRSFFPKMANSLLLGMCESYMDNHWDCNDLTELLTRILRSKTYLVHYNSWNRFLNYLQCGKFFNLQTQRKSWEVAERHFDLGNDLYESFLDPYMQYTCGYWANASNLNEAEINKMELIAQKLKLKPGMRVLDLGCGWGGLCKYLAEHHGVSCVGVNVSKEGVEWGRNACKNLPVEFRLCDYRDVNETFDRVVSIGMTEHVGPNNYRTFIEVVHRCLKDDGISLIHSIGVNDPDMLCAEPFFSKMLFPNGYLPYYKDLTDAIEGLFVLEDWHNFGNDYYHTLLCWRENFQKNWPKISSKYGERFYKMWDFYLAVSAAGFRSRQTQLWQLVLTKRGLMGGYRSVR